MVAEPAPQVLVVEDEPDLAALYRTWLADEYQVRVVNEGTAALSALDPTVDVVLLDRRMPNLSGDEVLAEIRDRQLDCRVAMVTAVTPDDDILELGFDDYLVKPVSRQDLHDVVEGLLRRSAHSDDLQEFFALVTKKALLDAEAGTSASSPDEARATLESRLQAKSRELETSLRELEPADFEVLFYDLQDDLLSDTLRDAD